MYIQYVDLNVTGRSRIYNFDVIDNKQAREFTVTIQSEAFRPGCLNLQDGPGICFTHLKLELEAETQESRAQAHLTLSQRDIQEYSEQHYPHKLSHARRYGIS